MIDQGLYMFRAPPNERMIDGWLAEYTPDYNAFVKALLLGDKKAMNCFKAAATVSSRLRSSSGSCTLNSIIIASTNLTLAGYGRLNVVGTFDALIGVRDKSL